jgi:phosphate transport system protein
MTGEHSSKQYDMDLETIRSKVLLMGGLVESQFQDAIAAFRSGNVAQAEQIIKADENVNKLEVSLDDACSHLIVKRQPAANDLRTVMATIKVITDLERIGDESTKIARAAKTISERGCDQQSIITKRFASCPSVQATCCTMRWMPLPVWTASRRSS